MPPKRSKGKKKAKSTKSDDMTDDFRRQVANATIKHVQRATGVVLTARHRKRLEIENRKLNTVNKVALEDMRNRELFIESMLYSDRDTFDLGDTEKYPDAPSSSDSDNDDKERDSRDYVDDFEDFEIIENQNAEPHYQEKTFVDDVARRELYDSVPKATWKQTTLTEDLESEGFFSNGSSQKTFQMDTFKSEVFGSRKRECESMKDLDEEEFELLNEEDPNKNFKIAEKEINDKLRHNTIVPWLEFTHAHPLGRAVLNSNIEEFFYELRKIIEDVTHTCSMEFYAEFQEVVPCNISGCRCNIILTPKKTQKALNVLHIAAAVSTIEFIQEIVCKDRYSKRLGSPDQIRYYETIFNFWLRRSFLCICPITIASESNRIDVVKLFLDNTGDIPLLGDHKNISLFESLVYHSNLDKLDENQLHKVREGTERRQFRLAVCVAVEIGDPKTINLLEELKIHYDYHGDKSLFLSSKDDELKIEKDRVPGLFTSCSTAVNVKENDPSLTPPVHVLALSSNYEIFKGLTSHEKLEHDCFMWTPLMYLLEFTDEQVKSELNIYCFATREDQFGFISQIIIRRRWELLECALTFVFGSRKNFIQIRDPFQWYKPYGLPDFVPLPMETALSRTGNMERVEMIAKFYLKQPTYAKMLIEVDALRCVRSIQDRASRCTDHVRLAVIFMMMKIVKPSEPAFIKLMKMHNHDEIGKYILNNYTRAHLVFEKNVTFLPWNDAFELAGAEIRTMGGTSLEEKYQTNLHQMKCTSPNIKMSTERPVFVSSTEAENRRREDSEKRVYRDGNNVLNGLAHVITLIENLNIGSEDSSG